MAKSFVHVSLRGLRRLTWVDTFRRCIKSPFQLTLHIIAYIYNMIDIVIYIFFNSPTRTLYHTNKNTNKSLFVAILLETKYRYIVRSVAVAGPYIVQLSLRTRKFNGQAAVGLSVFKLCQLINLQTRPN